MGYWDSKQVLSEKAVSHTAKMLNEFRNEIIASVDGSKVYSYKGFEAVDLSIESHWDLIATDSVSAIFVSKKYAGRTAVLNFASYKNPGGRFLDGSSAQEESLCHASFLYNVLTMFPDYYAYNSTYKDYGLYANRAIYSPKVRFFQDDATVKCDVITCAAPNWGAARKNGITLEENQHTLESRIDFVLGIAAEQKVDNLILGAFGCGVFKQDASVVAGIFMRLLSEKFRCFSNVIFAVPGTLNSPSGNLKAFYNEYKKHYKTKE